MRKLLREISDYQKQHFQEKNLIAYHKNYQATVPALKGGEGESHGRWMKGGVISGHGGAKSDLGEGPGRAGPASCGGTRCESPVCAGAWHSTGHRAGAHKLC